MPDNAETDAAAPSAETTTTTSEKTIIGLFKGEEGEGFNFCTDGFVHHGLDQY